MIRALNVVRVKVTMKVLFYRFCSINRHDTSRKKFRTQLFVGKDKALNSLLRVLPHKKLI